MEKEIKNEENFFKNHADTLAIIGVNLAIAAILISMWISHAHRVDAINARMDASFISANTRMNMLYTMFYDLLKEGKK